MTVDPEEAAKQTGETYAEKKAKEEANKAENAESIAVLIPNSLKLVEASNVCFNFCYDPLMVYKIQNSSKEIQI